MCNSMIEGGKVYVGSQAQFLASLWEMSAYFSADQEPAATAALNKLIQTLQVVLGILLSFSASTLFGTHCVSYIRYRFACVNTKYNIYEVE
jgi:hypothetical protein